MTLGLIVCWEDIHLLSLAKSALSHTENPYATTDVASGNPITMGHRKPRKDRREVELRLPGCLQHHLEAALRQMATGFVRFHNPFLRLIMF